MVTLEELAAAVMAMRQAQKRYFETKDRNWLVESKKREAVVDKMIGNLNTPKLF